MRVQNQRPKSSATSSRQASAAESGLGTYRLTSFGAYCESLAASTTVQRHSWAWHKEPQIAQNKIFTHLLVS